MTSKGKKKPEEPKRIVEPPREMHENSVRAANNFDAQPLRVLYVVVRPRHKRTNDPGRVIQTYETLEAAQRAVGDAKDEEIHQGFLFASTQITVSDTCRRYDAKQDRWFKEYLEYVHPGEPQYHIEVPSLGLVFGHRYK